MKTRKSLFLVSLLTVTLLVHAYPSSANFTVDVYINDAWYADLDDDGFEDDIAVNMTVYLSNWQIFTEIDLYVGIQLPSGTEFWFLSIISVEKYVYSIQFGVIAHLYNTAQESGWYQASAVGFAEGEQFSFMDTHMFDPPGGKEGLDPEYAEMYIY